MKNASLCLCAILTCLAFQTLLAQPRQLTEEDKAKLRAQVHASRIESLERQRREELARKQEELRRREQSIAFEEEDWEDEEPLPKTEGGFPGVLEAFSGTLANEMAKKQQEDAQRQQFLEGVRREAEAVDRQHRRQQERQREQERQHLAAERARLQHEATQMRVQSDRAGSISAAVAPTSTTAPARAGSDTANPDVPPQDAARVREEALRRSVAAERQRLAEERERAAAIERVRVMQPFVESSRDRRGPAPASAGTPAVSSGPDARTTPVDYGPAKAWCRASDVGTYQCMGPLQNLLSWYPSLEVALTQAGCPGGEGYPPTRGHGGSSFNCGRALRVNDYRMPTYDPYRGGGKPSLVTAVD